MSVLGTLPWSLLETEQLGEREDGLWDPGLSRGRVRSGGIPRGELGNVFLHVITPRMAVAPQGRKT